MPGSGPPPRALPESEYDPASCRTLSSARFDFPRFHSIARSKQSRTMLLIPAIDLKDGHCVRLKQGDMDQSTTFSEDPAAMARKWLEAGARRLHLVDLNGAFAGKPQNHAAIKAILREV